MLRSYSGGRISHPRIHSAGSKRFDREKLLNGLLRACETRPVPRRDLVAVVDSVESAIAAREVRELSTQEISMELLPSSGKATRRLLGASAPGRRVEKRATMASAVRGFAGVTGR